MKKKKKLYCKFCGKEIEKGKFCNKEEYIKYIKQNGTEHHNELSKLSNVNKCIQCGAVMDINDYSGYCDKCKLMQVYEHEVSI